MKCYRCDSEWETIKTVKYPRKCPYCGHELPIIHVGENTIKAILQERLVAIFDNAEVYRSCLLDKMPHMENELLESLIRAEAKGIHTFYKKASSYNVSNRNSFLKQAREELKKICPSDEYVSKIEKMYENAFLNSDENIVRRDYYDCDQAYINLAKELEHQARYTDSFRVLLVSIDAENSDACNILCNNIEKVRFCDAGIDIEHVEKIINKILASNRAVNYLKLANLYAYGDFERLNNSEKKAVALYEAAVDSDLAQAEVLVRRYMGFGTNESEKQIDVLKKLLKNPFAKKNLLITDKDCLENTKEFILSNNERVSSIATKLCYQMALYHWNYGEYKNAYLFWLHKCITFQNEANEDKLLTIAQIKPIDIGKQLAIYKDKLPDSKFLFRLIYEYCEYNNLYDEGYLYFEYADQYGIDSDYGKKSVALYQSGLISDGYVCFVNLFTKLLANNDKGKKINPKYRQSREKAEKYTYKYIIENLSSVDLKWIQYGCEQLKRWKAKKEDIKYVARFLLELIAGVGDEYLKQFEYSRAYDLLLAGCQIKYYIKLNVFDKWIETFYKSLLNNLSQITSSSRRLEYLEKGKELLRNSSNNALRMEILRKLAEEYRVAGWIVRFERLYKEAAMFGDAVAKDYFKKQGCVFLEEHGKLVCWLGEEKIISIPNSIVEIERNAFACNDIIRKVVIPETVKKIGVQAFLACKQLTEIEVQGRIYTIGSRAFADCANLSKVVLMKTPKHIERDAFENTSVLVVGNDISSVGGFLMEYRGKTETVCIQEGIEQIGANAFENAEFESITLPNSLNQIGEYGFSNCRNLNSVSIPKKVKVIGAYAFRSSGIKDIELGSVEVIGKGAFENSRIERVKIPGTVKSIESSIFEFCSDLKEVWIDKGVKKIEEDAFYGCDNLTKVYIPSSVVEIDEDAFEGRDMKIYGVANSYANQYANRMGISFVAQ